VKNVIVFFLFFFCIDGIAQTNVTFLSNLDPYPADDYANVWGYVAPDGTEYALLGTEFGTSIISVDDPENPVECDFIPAPQSIWRELKVYSHYAYVATDQTGDGLQIIDLAYLPDSARLVNTQNTYFNDAHDLLIDDGYCYVVGGDGIGGMSILDLSNPVNPVRTAYYTTSGYIHDIYIWNDTVVASCGSSQQYHLVNVTNKFSPQFISASQTLPGIYAHSGWMTEDKRYFFGTEEFNVRDMTVWDLQDRASWELIVPSWGLSNNSIIHNLYIKGNFAHISYYTSGYVVLDIINPANPQIAGQYDTYPSSNSGTYNGAWGVYPYLPSGSIIVSDINTGLYVLRFDGEVQTFSLDVSIIDGWNMVSTPGLHPVDQNVNTWWQFRDPNAEVFKFTGAYQIITSTEPKVGYWMKHTNDRIYNTGDEWPSSGILVVPHDPIVAAAGWNLIGGYDVSVPVGNITTTPPNLINTTIYGYNGSYTTATHINPGYAYWVKMDAAGSINLDSPFGKQSAQPIEYFDEDWGKITITDAAQQTFILYAVDGRVDLNRYEMPPMPPAGSFDIRYSSGRMAEVISSSIQTIEMSGIEYPVKVRVENMDIRLMDESGKALNEFIKSGEEVVIRDATISKLKVTGELKPVSYALEQNYPNPFNPITTIEFSLPEDVNNVKLTIYNALGERMAELINGSLTAGKYSYQWNAGNAATGMYIYKLRTNNFVSIKKKVLIK